MVSNSIQNLMSSEIHFPPGNQNGCSCCTETKFFLIEKQSIIQNKSDLFSRLHITWEFVVGNVPLPFTRSDQSLKTGQRRSTAWKLSEQGTERERPPTPGIQAL